MTTVAEWVADPACAGNAMTLLVAGIIYADEGNYVEALKACHTGLNLEMCGLSEADTCTAKNSMSLLIAAMLTELAQQLKHAQQMNQYRSCDIVFYSKLTECACRAQDGALSTGVPAD